MKNRKGFTLIELIIVLVLIGILAAVAIPRFANMQKGAADAQVKGVLGNVRSALTIKRAENMAAFPAIPTQGLAGDGTTTRTNLNNWWPSITDLETQGQVLDSPMAQNLHTTDSGMTPAQAMDVAPVASGTGNRPVAGNFGWNYDAATGVFWSNSSEATQDGFASNTL